MHCPVCGKEMKVAGTDQSHNVKTGAQYARTLYVCKADDAWVTTEVPVATT